MRQVAVVTNPPREANQRRQQSGTAHGLSVSNGIRPLVSLARLASRTIVAKKTKRDPKREERISMEVVVDCYNRNEVAMGWHYYLEGQLRFPLHRDVHRPAHRLPAPRQGRSKSHRHGT